MALDKLRTASGRKLRGEALTETALPVPYDAAATPGAIVLGTDGKLYASIKNPASAPYAWQSLPASGTEMVDVVGSLKVTNNLIAATGEGRVLIGSGVVETSVLLDGTIIPRLQITDDAGEVSLACTRFFSTSGKPPRIVFQRGRGTLADRQSVASGGTTLGQFLINGWDGTQWGNAVRIQGLTDLAVGSSSMPGRLEVMTSPAGTREPVLRLTINSLGNVQINNTTGTERLSVTGNIQVTEATNGFHVGANQVLGSRKTGWAAPTGTATRTTFVTSTVTTEQLAERVKALIDDLTTHGLIGT
jgi:hypothetical protein